MGLRIGSRVEKNYVLESISILGKIRFQHLFNQPSQVSVAVQSVQQRFSIDAHVQTLMRIGRVVMGVLSKFHRNVATGSSDGAAARCLFEH